MRAALRAWECPSGVSSRFFPLTAVFFYDKLCHHSVIAAIRVAFVSGHF